jgi:hypothetical protein
MSAERPSPHQPSPEERLVQQEKARASERDGEISDKAARIIAAWYHGGQDSAFYSFQSTGAIDSEGLQIELVQLYVDPETTDAMRRDLDFLGTYLINAPGKDAQGNRPPQEDWHERTKRWEPES